MMSCKFVTSEQAENYFEHSKDYYTKNQTNYDRWHGTLAEAYGLKGELSKEQFDEVLESIDKAGRKRAGLDCTFSAPKGVSLAMAKDEQTRQDMITSHQTAAKRAFNKIEIELLQTRSNGKTFLCHNAIGAEFMHLLARPTERNNFVPDLDLHSHIIIMNKTFADGKDLSIDFGKIDTDEMIKTLGLTYRQELAKELQAKGYELEITDSVYGFFDLKGFDHSIIMDYSNRRKDILETAKEHGMTDMQAANQYSRSKKEAGRAEYEEILEQTKQDLFDSGRIKIERRERTVDNDKSRFAENAGQLHLSDAEERERSHRDFGADQNDSIYKEFAGKPSLSDLPHFGVDAQAGRTNLLLPTGAINRLAKLQTRKVRDYYMFRTEKRERVDRIDRIAAETLKTLSRENFAFPIPEIRRRIMAAGVLVAITAEEAEKAMERAGVVKLGQMEREGQKTKDVYVVTEQNIKMEKSIVDRVQNGKGVITDKILTMDESRAALDRAEARAKAQGLKSASFTITGREGGSGEQAEAVHHILVSNDKYVCIDGLAGTGKTTMMERLKWIADEQGIEIKGACYSGKAADGLQAESGIESTTIHAFLNKLEGKGRTDPGQTGIRQEWDFSAVQKCQGREIWAIDEAGLVDMHLMDQLQKAAEARGAQVLLLGDPDQLPPVGAGEPMRQMMDGGMATAHLYDIRRQRDTELLRAVKESVQGDHLKTFEALKKQGNYREIEDKKARLNVIKSEMTTTALSDYKNNLLLVSTNADRKAYNHAIREEYVRRGELAQGEAYKITVHDREKPRTEKRDFAERDRIIFTANDRRLGVMNGTMATIEKIEGQEITAKLDSGERVTWDIEKYNSIDHSYAVTNYKAQGMTVDKVVADMSTKGAAQSRNALYVDISRARHNAVVYTDNKEKLERQTKDFARKITSKDFAKKLQEMRDRGGITNNDRYHAPEDKGEKLEKALAQIREHTREAPTIVKTWEKSLEAKQEQERQAEAKAKAAELAKADRQQQTQKAAEKAPEMEIDFGGR